MGEEACDNASDEIRRTEKRAIFARPVRDSADGGSQSLVSSRIRHPVFPASCQLPVSGSLLSVQISGAYPCNTPVAQCPPCLTRERSEQVSTQCAEEGRRVAGCIVSERGKRQ